MLEKTGRNTPCPCGSGKKYKKCCLGKNIISRKKQEINSTKQDFDQERLLMTTTNEVFMPVRLYYKIKDVQGLIQRLEQLKCVDWESDDRFFINYIKEAKNIGLSVKYKKVPKHLYPIILAHGHIAEELHLDLYSFERAVRIIEFIDRHIDRDIIKICYIASYNRVQAINEQNIQSILQTNYDELFSDGNMKIIDPKKAILDELEALVTIIGIEQKRKNASGFLGSQNRDFPLIEKFPVHYYEEGIEQVDMGLKLRMTLAIKHWKGYENYTMLDLINEIASEKSIKV